MTPIKIAAIIQARMSSTRFPGKVLCEVKGKPLLGYLLERLRKSKDLDRILVGTSVDSSDEPIVKFCQAEGVECYRGPLDNVSKRFLEMIHIYRLDSFVRISADSPFLDAQLVDEAVGIFQKGSYDMVTNVHPRSFPKGESVEVLRSDVFSRSYSEMKEAEEFEHVTSFFYKNAEGYKIFNLSLPSGDYSKVNLSVDTQDDFEVFDKILGQMTRPFSDYGWKEIVGLYERCRPALRVSV